MKFTFEGTPKEFVMVFPERREELMRSLVGDEDDQWQENAGGESGETALKRSSHDAGVPLVQVNVVNGKNHRVGSDLTEVQAQEAATPEDVTKAREDIGEEIDGLRAAVDESLDEKGRVSAESARRRATIEEMADGPDRFLAGLSARITEPEDRGLFFALLEKTTDGGRERSLSYTEIGQRLGGITKQAVHVRVEKFKRKYRQASEYVDSRRSPKQADPFSVLSPSQREKEGIDKSYNHDVR